MQFYNRSLLIYHCTPIMEAGLISPIKIDKLESTLQRNFLKIPNDIRNDLLQKICGWNKCRASEVILNIIQKRVNPQILHYTPAFLFDSSPTQEFDSNDPNMFQNLSWLAIPSNPISTPTPYI